MSRIRNGRDWLRPVLRDRSFWLGLGGLVAGLALITLLINFAAMPLWTRHGAEVTVPNLTELTGPEAQATLRRAGLQAERRAQPYNPSIEADIVVEQVPEASSTVKPGRRVYFYLNESPKELVEMPDLRSLSEGQARPRVDDLGLVLQQVITDTLRTPYANTVTRQLPSAGKEVPKGTRVTLWISPGPSDEEVRVPDVTGLPPESARRRLREAGFYVNSPRATGERVLWQDPEGGHMQHGGEEVFIHTTPRVQRDP